MNKLKSIRKWGSENKNKVFAWGLGIGLALFAIHWENQPGLNILFLPSLGLILIVVCLFLYFESLKKWPDFGPKIVWIPMLVIVASIIGSVILDFSFFALASGVFSIALFGIYVASRELGKDIFMAFIPFVLIVALSCIIDGIIHPGEITGGIITNYCASAGFMIFGTMVNKFKWQWVLATLVLIALFFVGALEGLFAVAVLGIIILARQDWGKRIFLPVGLVAVFLIIWVSLGHFTTLWGKTNLSVLWSVAKGEEEVSEETISIATTGRWDDIANRMGDIKPLGRGYWITMPFATEEEKHEFSHPDIEPIHNVPLVIVDQVGPVAGVAWLFITIFCLVKTKWKYAWSAVLALCVFDHYIWTQLAPYWWALVGISTTVAVKDDYIFRGERG